MSQWQSTEHKPPALLTPLVSPDCSLKTPRISRIHLVPATAQLQAALSLPQPRHCPASAGSPQGWRLHRSPGQLVPPSCCSCSPLWLHRTLLCSGLHPRSVSWVLSHSSTAASQVFESHSHTPLTLLSRPNPPRSQPFLAGRHAGTLILITGLCILSRLKGKPHRCPS